jgi:DNA-directed RNA polymerase specialized sigma subunit
MFTGTNYREEDLKLLREWKHTNNPQVLDSLLQRLQPLIQREVQKWQGTVPSAVLESKARVLTTEALKTYDEHRGTALSTHIVNRLQKLSRDVYPHQQVARLPENVQLKYNTFQVASNILYDKLGRDPTVDELADELAWPVRQVSNFNNAYARKEFVESEDVGGMGDDSEDSLVDFYYHGLPPDDKTVFEDMTGYGGKPVLNNSSLTHKYKMTQNQLSYKKRQFVNKLQDLQQGKF